jgi:phosphoglucosamine mutase
VAKSTLADYTGEVRIYPQVLVNVRVAKGFDFRNDAAVQTAVAEAQCDLESSGRVLLRASGTEPVVRVMVEGSDGDAVRQWAEKIAAAVRRAAG